MDEQRHEQVDRQSADATPEKTAAPTPALDGGTELTDEQLERASGGTGGAGGGDQSDHASGGMGSMGSSVKKSLIGNFPR